MVQQNRTMMTLMNVLAHASSLRRKQRGIYPQGIQLPQMSRDYGSKGIGNPYTMALGQ